jgi:hypothetical protein
MNSVTGRPPTPIADVYKNWTSLGGRFDASVTARDIAIAYEGFLGDAGINACQVAHSKEGRERIDRIRSMARTKWRVWSDLDGPCIILESYVQQRLAEMRTCCSRLGA